MAIFSLFAAIVGSVSFWGSNIAFAKLQEILPGRPITVGPGRTQQLLNLALLLVAVACAVAIVAGSDAEMPHDRAAARARRCSATSSCCRSAAPTCRWSSRC